MEITSSVSTNFRTKNYRIKLSCVVVDSNLAYDGRMSILDINEKLDLKDLTPESWCCVDCGVNTSPGMPPTCAVGALDAKGWRSNVVRHLGQRGLHSSQQRMEAGRHGANGRLPVHWLFGAQVGAQVKAERFPARRCVQRPEYAGDGKVVGSTSPHAVIWSM
jgi:hypothetical protein